MLWNILPEESPVPFRSPYCLSDRECSEPILAKVNLGMHRDLAPITIAVGPGFEAGKDVDAVVESQRGHHLGRVFYEGCAAPNTGIPGKIGGFDKERVIHSPEEGVHHWELAAEVICDSFENLKEYLKPNGFYVVTTRGHGDDFLCVKTILQENIAGYLGMIGSKLKVKKTSERLREEGFDEAQIETVHAPIGLAIGAVTPGEIAISILSQIIQMKNQKNVASTSERLLNTREPGMLCIIIEKHGSAPRGTGSMMLVTNDTIIDSIGGGPVEYVVIEDARKHPEFGIRKYHLDTQESQKLGMICGGSNTVLFVPV